MISLVLFYFLKATSIFIYIYKINYIYIKYYMNGGLIQLVTSGKQDVSLTYNPEITFFKN